MKIIEPSVELVGTINGEEILAKLERCGRVSRKSEGNITADSAEQFVRSIIKRGHESVLEHVQLTFKIVCDRAIQNELVRHRHASFTVESTRYIKYDELTFIKPEFWAGYREASMAYRAFTQIEKSYAALIELGCPPEQARAVLPLCTATELYMTCNLREWRHVLKLRTAKAAHPQMRFVAGKILDILREKLPVIVEDINP